MKLQLFLVCCILQSIYSFSVIEHELAPRIIGGEDAPEGFAPFQCSVQRFRSHLCGCAIIDKEFVLTSKECVRKQDVDHIQILVGTNDLRKGGTYYEVLKIIKHYSTNDDIALIRMDGSIQFNEKVQPIVFDDEEVPEGAKAQLTGWGHTKECDCDYNLPSKLQVVELDIIQTRECMRHNETPQGPRTHYGNICTSTDGGKGACKFDQGNPLVYGKKLVGIQSYIGSPLGCVGYLPDVYSKISYYFDWMKENMEIKP